MGEQVGVPAGKSPEKLAAHSEKSTDGDGAERAVPRQESNSDAGFWKMAEESPGLGKMVAESDGVERAVPHEESNLCARSRKLPDELVPEEYIPLGTMVRENEGSKRPVLHEESLETMQIVEPGDPSVYQHNVAIMAQIIDEELRSYQELDPAAAEQLPASYLQVPSVAEKFEVQTMQSFEECSQVDEQVSVGVVTARHPAVDREVEMETVDDGRLILRVILGSSTVTVPETAAQRRSLGDIAPPASHTNAQGGSLCDIAPPESTTKSQRRSLHDIAPLTAPRTNAKGALLYDIAPRMKHQTRHQTQTQAQSPQGPITL